MHQLMQNSNSHWIEQAFALAQQAALEDEVPVGALVIYQGKVIGQGYNQREKTQNPIAHAEVLAIQNAAAFLKSWRLVDCTLIVTLEPCVMCLAVCQQARIQSVFYGISDQKAGALSLGYGLHEDVRCHHRFSVTSLDHQKSGHLLQQFFKKKRVNRRSDLS